jgi:ferredoxin
MWTKRAWPICHRRARANWRCWTNVAAERRPNSRLACQIKASPALDGLTVTLPETQE